MINNIYNKVLKFIKENIKYIVTLIIIILMFFIELPYSVNAPGGLIDLSDRVKTDSKGTFNMTYVTFMKGKIPAILLSFIMPDWDLIPNNQAFLEGEDINISNIRGKIQYKSAVSNAILNAYKEANIDINIKSTHIYTTYILDKSKNDLLIGDEIISIDGMDISNISDIKSYISSLNNNTKVLIKVINNNKYYDRYAYTYDIDGTNMIGVGFSLINEYDGIDIGSKSNEFGSSGGLMLTLALYDKITDGDFTKGLKISGTGTIDEEGNIGEIDGVKYKLIGAVKNKSDIFLVPSANYEEAIKIKNNKKYNIKIIEAKTFKQVLEELNNI